MRGSDFAPQIAAKAGLRTFLAKMPFPAFFIARAFFLADADLAILPAVFLAALIFFLWFFSNCYSNFWLIFGKLWEARSRLYRGRLLQVNSKYSFENSWRDLQDLQAFAPLSIKKINQISSNLFAFSQLLKISLILVLKRFLKFTNFDERSKEFQHFLRKRPTSVRLKNRFSNFLRFRNGNYRFFRKWFSKN